MIKSYNPEPVVVVAKNFNGDCPQGRDGQVRSFEI